MGLVNAFWDLEFDWEMDCVLWLGLMGLSSSFFFGVGRLDTLFLPGWFSVEMVVVVVDACC